MQTGKINLNGYFTRNYAKKYVSLYADIYNYSI